MHQSVCPSSHLMLIIMIYKSLQLAPYSMQDALHACTTQVSNRFVPLECHSSCSHVMGLKRREAVVFWCAACMESVLHKGWGSMHVMCIGCDHQQTLWCIWVLHPSEGKAEIIWCRASHATLVGPCIPPHEDSHACVHTKFVCMVMRRKAAALGFYAVVTRVQDICALLGPWVMKGTWVLSVHL